MTSFFMKKTIFHAFYYIKYKKTLLLHNLGKPTLFLSFYTFYKIKCKQNQGIEDAYFRQSRKQDFIYLTLSNIRKSFQNQHL